MFGFHTEHIKNLWSLKVMVYLE